YGPGNLPSTIYHHKADTGFLRISSACGYFNKDRKKNKARVGAPDMTGDVG
ncbi:unnamed protein product, partial [marine sediment metagenome]